MRPPTVAGMAIVLVAAALIAGVWLTGSAEGGDGGLAAGATPAATVEGPRARVALTSNMYGAPSRSGELVAIIPEGRDVRVTGRTDDSSWIRVNYPVTSTLEGWVPAANFVEASVPDLAAVPDVARAGGGGEAEGASPLAGPALADFTVSSADVGPSGALTVRVTNVGRAPFSGSVGLSITTVEGEIVGVLEVDLTGSELGPGRSASVPTGIVVRETGLYLVEVDPENQIEEASEFDNSRRVLLVGIGE